MIPVRRLGRTGIDVTCIGLGGEGVLRTYGRDREARAVITRALEGGITYLESARAYAASEDYYGQVLGPWRERIFLASKAHDRTAAGAEAMLHTTLASLRTDHLDLWQVHDVRCDADLARIFDAGGAIEAFDRARCEGKVRFVGITGHQDPKILLKALSLYDFDTVLLPVNPAEPTYLSFPENVLAEARRRDMGIIAMKVLCHGIGLRVPGCDDPALWIRYALDHEISTMVVGCDTPDQVTRNIAAAGMPPLSAVERRELEARVGPFARRLMYYKQEG